VEKSNSNNNYIDFVVILAIALVNIIVVKLLINSVVLCSRGFTKVISIAHLHTSINHSAKGVFTTIGKG